jgi:exosortase O
MRIAAAQIVQHGLGFFGIHSVTVDTILVMESGLAQIDLPCSGVKSLWTGALFLIAATWIERRLVNVRWIGVAALTAVMLFLANVARVAVLVLLDQVMGWPFVAELFHVPLGVLAFTVVCIAALFMLQKLPVSQLPSGGDVRRTPEPARVESNVLRPNWLALALALAIAGMALLYQPYPHAAAAEADIRWAFPTGFDIQESPLSPEHYAWITQDGADSASRWNFTVTEGGTQVTGSILFLTSATWRGQHQPERCFEVQGQKVEGSQTIVFEPGFPARFLYLSAGPVRASALYWLQAGDRVTDDFATRIWADLTPDNQRWVLVTVLLDDVYEINDPAVRGLAADVRAVVANSLKGELP